MSRVIDEIPLPSQPSDLKVIVLSYPRNGTHSFHEALTIMGYRSYHLVTCWQNGPEDMRIAREGLLAKLSGIGKPFGRDEFDKWFENYDAVMDIAAFFAPELIKAYPDAKFILVHRDPSTWMRSMRETIMPYEEDRSKFPIRYMRLIDGYTRDLFNMTDCLGQFLWKRTDEDDKDLRSYDRALKGYREYNEMVQRMIPPEKLLVLRLEDGLCWESICPFLGEPVPDLPFPASNNPAEFKQRLRGIIRTTWTRTLVLYTIAALLPLVGVMWYAKSKA